jgi:hypothetical protein
MKQKIHVLLVMMSKLTVVSGMAYFLFNFFSMASPCFCAHACHRRKS